jgi:hypothetical protein
MLGLLATAVELAMERHWKSNIQLVPWLSVAAGTVGVVLLLAWPSHTGVRVAQVVAGVLFVTALIGVGVHIHENYNAGPLDYRYAERWEAMTFVSRLWTAATKSVGPAPVLAPLVLAQVGVSLALATIGLPKARANPRSEAAVPG